jgi:gas vesicle protein
MSESNSRGAFYAGLLLGGLVGAAAALLMTPQPGRQTRLQIQTKGSEFQSQLGDVTSRLQDRGRATVHETLTDESEEIDAGPAAIPPTEGNAPPASETTA